MVEVIVFNGQLSTRNKTVLIIILENVRQVYIIWVKSGYSFFSPMLLTVPGRRLSTRLNVGHNVLIFLSSMFISEVFAQALIFSFFQQSCYL